MSQKKPLEELTKIMEEHGLRATYGPPSLVVYVIMDPVLNASY